MNVLCPFICIHCFKIHQQDEQNLKDYKGILYFEEINKNIEYFLPCGKNTKPLFVIRGKN